jgi:putative transposase
VDPENISLSITEQCRLLGISRSTYYYKTLEWSEEKDLEDLKLILEVLKNIPFYGYRKVSRQLIDKNPHLTRKRVRRIMKRFGLRAIYPGPNLSKRRKNHKIFPYLLKNKVIRYPNQVWASDITYINLQGCYVYLIVILDLFSRKVLSWRLSNTCDASFCIAALEEAIMRYGEPAIFNTDQGSQFTSDGFIQILKDHHIRISMDSVGRALDNVYVERLWRSLKYEDIYIKSYDNMIGLSEGVSRYFHFYNSERFHQSHDYRTPDEMYRSFVREEMEFAKTA